MSLVDTETLSLMSLQDISRLIRRREISVEQVADTILARVEALDPVLHAFITVAMLGRGIAEDTVVKILGRNFLRVFEAACG